MPRIVHECSDALPELAEVFHEHGFDAASLALFSALVGSDVKSDLVDQQAQDPAPTTQGVLVLTCVLDDEEVVAQRLIAKAGLELKASDSQRGRWRGTGSALRLTFGSWQAEKIS